jgi:hypothetical protein
MSEEMKDQSLQDDNVTPVLDSEMESLDAPVAIEDAAITSVETELDQEEELAPIETVAEVALDPQDVEGENVESQPVVQEKVVAPVVTPVVEVSIEPEVVAPITEEQLLKRIGELRTQIDSYIFEVDTTDDALEKAQDKHDRVLAVQEEFVDWIDKRRASYAWKLVERLRGYREKLNSDEASIRAFAAEKPELEFGFAEKTRKWFMKRFMLNFTISWVTIIILYLLHRSAGSISSWVTGNVGNAGWQKFLQLLIENLIGPGFWNVLGYIFGLSLAHFIGLLFAYSRRNSEYSQHVAEESARTLAMDNGIHDVREARERIDSLHPQVPQILELLSLGLHNPWKVNEEALLFSGSIPDASKMPASVEIAIPTISKSSPVYEELVYKTMNQIQRPGWRSEAFSRVIQKLANSLGFGHNGMALRELDEDQRRSGKRLLLLNIASEQVVFELIGDDLVESFTAITQEKILPTVQPLVATLKPNPLADLALSGSLLKDDSEEVSQWEVKLAEIAGHAAPWSSETFSSAGAANKKHESLESVFLASDRVQGLAANGIEAHADVRPGSRPFEVAIRVDLSQWCKPNEVAIFEDFQPSAEQLNRWDRKSSGIEPPDSLEATTEAPSGLVI